MTGGWFGIFIEPKPIVGGEVWSVVISERGKDIRERLFDDRIAASTFALERADLLDLPMFDNSDPGDVP
jgi:hypothetical protein